LTARFQRCHDADMGIGAGNQRKAAWVFLVLGAVIGLATGLLVSITTDVPLAPEAGLAVGVFGGWLVLRARR
jgi:formate-dependent nitrite reductase membrane component NrfD